jgi:tetratricopeptide (TPR) repeat protein
VKRIVFLIVTLLSSGITGLAQSWPPSGSHADSRGSAASAAFDSDDRDLVVLSGNVMVEGGVPLPQPAVIQSNCGGDIRNLSYTDARGYFAFRLSGVRDAFADKKNQFPGSSTTLSMCELQAFVPGFVSNRVRLSGFNFQGTIQVGHIMIHSARREAGNVISVTGAAAPGKARKHFEKGCEEANQANWDSAAHHFREAVRRYSKYAQAWLYLGRVQVQQGQVECARQSFHEALAADPNFVDPYVELAHLAFGAKQWREVADDTEHILEIDPAGTPMFWYFNSVANYELKRVDKAEQSALQGIRVDKGKRIPQLQYLLAVISAFKHDYPGAVEHMRLYLRLAPQANVAVAQEQLREFEKLSGAPD